MRRAGGRRAQVPLPQGDPSAAPRALEGGFVWVVISGPTREPLMIRKSNKQGNPVFHTQPWAPPERLCVSSSPPHGAAVPYGGVGGGKSAPIHPGGLVCDLGPARKAAHRPGSRFRRQRSSAGMRGRARMVPGLPRGANGFWRARCWPCTPRGDGTSGREEEGFLRCYL